MREKRGVTPIIATVLLIGLTVALAIIIFAWTRGFITEQIEKFGKSVDQACEELSYDAEIVPAGANVYDLYLSNRGNIPIYAVDIKKIGPGKSQIDRRTITIAEGQSVKEAITLERSVYDTVLVMPVILGNARGAANKKAYACPQQYSKQIKLPL
ncbi:MAG: archaellin/type IV pilin N-terminal domain-containing protein [archaeon]